MLQYSPPIVRWLASCLVYIMYYQRAMQLLQKKKKKKSFIGFREGCSSEHWHSIAKIFSMRWSFCNLLTKNRELFPMLEGF